MSKTCYIAWHPKYGIRPATEDGGIFCVEDSDEVVIHRTEKYEGWTIQPVCIIEENRIRELWEYLHIASKRTFDNVDLDNFMSVLESILPEPKAKVEDYE